MSKERLETEYAIEVVKRETVIAKGTNNRNNVNLPIELVLLLIEQAERVQELKSFKNSVEYTVDSESLELIISNQDSKNVLKMSETYDEKIYKLQQQNKRYREAINNINEKAALFGANEHVNEAIQEAIRALDLEESE